MSKNLAINETHDIVNIEDTAMSVEKVLSQIALIQNVMKRAMKKDEHYGIIPGTDKPTLLKSGAEKLCLTFRLDPRYDVIDDIRSKDHIAYTVKCTLIHIPTSVEIATGIGSCNSREKKYRYYFKNTKRPVPKEYWKNKDPELLGGTQFSARKVNKQWVIYERIENDNPWDLDNTLIKMACKRALVAATLNATAASDIFTQDIEEMPQELLGSSHEDKKQPITDGELQGTPGAEAEDDKKKIDTTPIPHTTAQATLIIQNIIGSHLANNFEKYRLAKKLFDGENILSKTVASGIVEWWLGDSKKKIEGEHEKRMLIEKQEDGEEKLNNFLSDLYDKHAKKYPDDLKKFSYFCSLDTKDLPFNILDSKDLLKTYLEYREILGMDKQEKGGKNESPAKH